MSGHFKNKNVGRIIDANLNRLKEGLRVCEEIARFIIQSPNLTLSFKRTRHNINLIIKQLPANTALLKGRDSLKDIGRNIQLSELKRENYQDIFFANIQRVKESTRVLEEFTKLINKEVALKFKRIRYRIYEIEKRTAEKFPSLYYRR